MIDKTLIGATEFQFISVIIPEADSQGQIIEESPALKYHNVKEMPLNKYGDGPLCRFKIPNLTPFHGYVGGQRAIIAPLRGHGS